MKNILIVLIFFSLGYGISYTVTINKLEKTKSDLEKQVSELETKFSKLKEKLTLITNIDIKEYLELRDNKAKYEKADEILGKIMIIFLADLKIHFDNKIVTPLNSHAPQIEVKEEVVKDVKAKEVLATEVEANESEGFHGDERHYFDQDNLTLTSTKNRLKKIRIKDPLLLTKSIPMKWNNPLFKKMNGHFIGNLFLEKNIVDNMEASIDLALENGKVTGEIEVGIYRKGNRYSHLRGSGENKNILYLKNKPRQIILKVSPSSYLQLVYVRNQDSFIGNYYDDHKFVGVAKIKRK